MAALRAEPAIDVVGTAVDFHVARERLNALQPDVVTLDLDAPRMNGLAFLRMLMAERPRPVIALSTVTHGAANEALEALRLGAFAVIGKPACALTSGELGPQLVARIRAAAGASLHPRFPERTKPARRPAIIATRRATSREAILLGASTGGTEALEEVLTALPANMPGIAIVQDLPSGLSSAFAARLNDMCAMTVREATDGERLEPGVAVVAPGDYHLLLHWNADHYRVRVVRGPAVCEQRPAVDVLFKSAADCGTEPYVVAGVFTGMGRDGANGLRRLRDLGATTFAQDEATSVVYGMPRAAWENGAAQRQLPLERTADFLITHFSAQNRPSSAAA